MPSTLLALLLGLLAPPPAAQPTPEQVAAWREDLRFLRHALPVTHPNPFANFERERWESAAAALDARLPTLRRTEWLVEVQRLVAHLGDAHTTVGVVQPALAVRYYPLELYQSLTAFSTCPKLKQTIHFSLETEQLGQFRALANAGGRAAAPNVTGPRATSLWEMQP